MKATEISEHLADICVVEFEDGRNTIAVVTHAKFKGSLCDAPHWAGALNGLVELAVNTVPESEQVEFEKILLAKFSERVSVREETMVSGKIGEELQ